MSNKKEDKNGGKKWIVHYVTSGCKCLLDQSYNSPQFKPYVCNIHTHGMREFYNHPEFQFVLNIGMDKAVPILNILGFMVSKGRRFKTGEFVSKVIANYDIRLDEAVDYGKKVLRVVIPDANAHFPGDKDCEEIYNLQLLNTNDLFI